MIDLKLDTNAVMKLFDTPEARVNLQQAVINNVVKELVLKNSKNKVQETIQKEISLVGARLPDVAEPVREEMAKFFKKKGWDDVTGTIELDNRMRQAASKLANERVVEAVQEHIDDAMEQLKSKVDYMLKISEQQMTDIVERQLNKVFTCALNKAIATRLEAAGFGVVVK